MKVQFNKGKYKGMTANGKDYDTAVKNLRNKANNKEKRELLYSLTKEELQSLFSLLDCQLSVEEDEFNECVYLDGECWGFTDMKQVDDLSIKLQKLIRLFK
jgi:hypothetical protein